MTDIKTYLDTEYPEAKRKNLIELHLFGKDLEGELNLKAEEFPQLERIFSTSEVKIIIQWEINLTNILKLTEPKGIKIQCRPNVELLTYTLPTEILDKKYPVKDKGAITKLDLSKHGLRGKIDLKDFTGLEELKIELSSPGLDRHFSSNFITGLDLSASTKLKKLTLTNSPAELDLDIFTNLTALEELNIPKKYVHWIGSLKSLENVSLKTLDISNNSKITDWDSLPTTITNLNCKGIRFEKQIKPFAFDVKAWKIVNHSDLVETDKAKLIKELNSKLEESCSTIKDLNKIGLTNDNLLSQIEILEVKNRELLK